MAEDERMYFSDQYIGRRCRKLAEHGLLQNLRNGVYAITEDGERYLEGEFDAAELEGTEE